MIELEQAPKEIQEKFKDKQIDFILKPKYTSYPSTKKISIIVFIFVLGIGTLFINVFLKGLKEKPELKILFVIIMFFLGIILLFSFFFMISKFKKGHYFIFTSEKIYELLSNGLFKENSYSDVSKIDEIKEINGLLYFYLGYETTRSYRSSNNVHYYKTVMPEVTIAGVPNNPEYLRIIEKRIAEHIYTNQDESK